MLAKDITIEFKYFLSSSVWVSCTLDILKIWLVPEASTIFLFLTMLMFNTSKTAKPGWAVELRKLLQYLMLYTMIFSLKTCILGLTL